MLTLEEILTARRLSGATPVERLLIQRWVGQFGLPFEGFSVNFRLGDGADPGPSYSESTRRAAVLLTQKRVDLVAHQGQSPWLVEVKVRGGLASVGQLIGYRRLWMRQYPGTQALTLALVATGVDPDLQLVLQDEGIRLTLYPDLTPERR